MLDQCHRYPTLEAYLVPTCVAQSIFKEQIKLRGTQRTHPPAILGVVFKPKCFIVFMITSTTSSSCIRQSHLNIIFKYSTLFMDHCGHITWRDRAITSEVSVTMCLLRKLLLNHIFGFLYGKKGSWLALSGKRKREEREEGESIYK